MPPGEKLNIADYFLFDRIREGNGAREAIRTDSGSVTYDEVGGMAAGVAERLRQLRVEREQRVLIALPDGPEFAATIFGILSMGGVAVMINPELRPDHLGAVLHAARAPVAVVAPEHRPLIEAAISPGTAMTRLLEIDRGGTIPAGKSNVTVATRPDNPAIWLFSGGTTGVPKIVVQSHRSFTNTTELYAKATLGYRSEDVTIAVPRLYFGYATGSNLFFPFSVGATSVLFPDRPTPDKLFEQIQRHRPSILITAPSAINAMVSHPEGENADLTSLRFATSAGEALPETLYHRWRQRFGVELLDGLGTAEMWHIFVTNRLGDVKVGTVGKVVEGFEVRACDESGFAVETGEVGRMWVKGDSLGLGYWEDPAQTAEAFRGEWFVGGDLISIDRHGYVTHRGRADDAIKVKGKWLRPQEVESVLLEHEAVKECAVVAVEDADGLLKPVAFVVVASEVEAAELQRHVLDRLEPYKHPRRVVFVEELPQTHLGKVDRARLKALASGRW
ncbi:MAG: benzoate-CoA ligase family protein [Acidimicrobiia bacterium]